MQPHQERVVKERDDLEGRITKLGAFFDTKVFVGLDESERGRLYRQHGLMQQYCAILNERIATFTS